MEEGHYALNNLEFKILNYFKRVALLGMDEPRGDADEGAQVFRLDLLLLQHSSRAATLLPSTKEKRRGKESYVSVGKEVVVVSASALLSGTPGTFACRGFFCCQL